MAERKWTPAQQNAITADSGTILVSAAAGSGKTSVLVERIVNKLTSEKSPVPPESLLVVTFTNAAAAEMRARIAVRVSAFVASSKENRKENILLLSKLSEMQVCTMDSFCMNLVKENFHSLGIDADFSMLEAGESAELKKKAAKTVLERRFTEEAESFIPLAKMFDSGKNDARLIESIIKLSDFSKSEPDADFWLSQVNEGFSEGKIEDSIWGKCILQEAYSDTEYALELIKTALEEINEDEELSAKYYARFASEAELLEGFLIDFNGFSWDERADRLEHILNIISERMPNAPKGYKDNPSKRAASLKHDAMKDVLEKILSYTGVSQSEHNGDIKHLKGIASELINTVREYNSVLLELKNEAGAYDFNDISHFALRLLSDKSAPDGKSPLARELTEGFSEILIDEYQDTNRAQDELFRLVSKNGENMFFVGDVKQSIYRFRLASPEMFIEKCESYPYYDGKSKKSKIILGENFRSRKGILEGVNFVFSQIMSSRCGDIDYNEDERLNFPSSLTPEKTQDVEVSIIESEDNNGYDAEADYIASTVYDYMRSGYMIKTPSGERRARWSDFCILMRSPSGIAGRYIKALKEYGIPVSSEVARSYFEAPEIKTIMSYLHVIDNPGRETDLLAVMMSPLFGFSADDVTSLKLRYGVRLPLYSVVLKGEKDGDEKCCTLRNKLIYFKRLAACVAADEVIRRIYSDSSYISACLAMSDGASRKKNLQLFLEKAVSTQESYTTLGSFLRYMDVLRESGADTGSAAAGNGVHIMSMHKSKGLEFPVVFIAGSGKKLNRTDINDNLVINHHMGFGLKVIEPENIKKYDTLTSHAVKIKNNADMISEEIRVYYVALTRAVQKLIIPIGMKGAEKKLEERQLLLAGFDKIPPYLLKHSYCASQWLISAFQRHPDGKELCMWGRYRGKPEGSVKISYLKEPEVKENVVIPEEKRSFDEGVVEEIERKVFSDYKYLPVASSLSKHTASSLAEEHFDPAGFGKSVPAFMYSDRMSPADIGTATHRFLQFCDFEKCRQDTDSEIARLVREGRLDEKQAAVVDSQAIKEFVFSDVAERIKRAESVFREKQFTMAKSICEIDPLVPREFSEEKTVVIGKIDLVFTEGKNAVIVDYKTDNITDIGVLAVRYRKQMELYAEALGKSMEMSVSECILYSLRLKKSISVFF